MGGSAIPWFLSSMLVLLLIGGWLYHRHCLKQNARQSADQEEELQRRNTRLVEQDKQLQNERQARTDERKKDSQKHAQDLTDRDDRHRREISQHQKNYTDLLVENTALRNQYTRNLEWDLRSRTKLATMLEGMGFNGVLITNVTFIDETSSPTSPVIAQVDHVIVGESGAVIVENKGWKGLIYDGKKPSDDFPAFSAVIDDSTWTGSFAVQFAPERDTGRPSIDVRLHTGDSAPGPQVRRQASRLHAFMKAGQVTVPWFDTCVFYSHDDAVVRTAGTDGNGRTATLVTADLQALRQQIEKWGGHSPLDVLDIAAKCSHHGADVRGFGRFRSKWPDRLSSATREPKNSE